VVALVVACPACGKSTAPAASATPAASADVARATDAGGEFAGADDGGEPMDAREAAAWARASDGGDDDDARLSDLVGCPGLRERAGDARLRPTAIRAMGYCRDFSELPWLADVGAKGSDADAIAALDAVVDQAAHGRLAMDPEDADELHAGCATLLDLARAGDRPVPRRVRAIRALRMLSERGCVKRADIPTDLDAK
jgi:hypothetical protein